MKFVKGRGFGECQEELLGLFGHGWHEDFVELLAGLDVAKRLEVECRVQTLFKTFYGVYKRLTSVYNIFTPLTNVLRPLSPFKTFYDPRVWELGVLAGLDVAERLEVQCRVQTLVFRTDREGFRAVGEGFGIEWLNNWRVLMLRSASKLSVASRLWFLEQTEQGLEQSEKGLEQSEQG